MQAQTLAQPLAGSVVVVVARLRSGVLGGEPHCMSLIACPLHQHTINSASCVLLPQKVPSYAGKRHLESSKEYMHASFARHDN